MNRISRSSFKFVQSLRHKKYRVKEQCFLVEGEKSVDELLKAPFDVTMVVCTALLWDKYEKRVLQRKGVTLWTTTQADMMRIGSLQSNNSVIAVAKQLPHRVANPRSGEWSLALDTISDPGNLGAIVRAADWFGIRQVVASMQTVEYYNPKVIHATMGSFTRVRLHYTPLEDYLAAVSLPVYGLFLGGKPIDTVNFGKRGGVLVAGNESGGISDSVAAYVDHKVGIPSLGGAESLNVAMASGIAMYEATRSKP